MATVENPVILVLGDLSEVVTRFEANYRVVVGEDDVPSQIASFAEEVAVIAVRGRAVNNALIASLPNLALIACYGVGYDQIDVAAATARGIIVTNTPDILTDEVADFTVGLVLATLRQIPQADRYLRSGEWVNHAYPLSTSLRNRKVGILGLGRIGQAIAQRLAAFEVPIHYHNRHKVDVPYTYQPDLLALATAVDVLIVTVPGGEATLHLVNAEVLLALGVNGILINVSRGSVVDQIALIEALQHETILAAGLDVYAHEPKVPEALLAFPNTVLTPHIASGTVYTRTRMMALLLDNLTAWLDEGKVLTPVQ